MYSLLNNHESYNFENFDTVGTLPLQPNIQKKMDFSQVPINGVMGIVDDPVPPMPTLPKRSKKTKPFIDEQLLTLMESNIKKCGTNPNLIEIIKAANFLNKQINEITDENDRNKFLLEDGTVNRVKNLVNLFKKYKPSDVACLTNKQSCSSGYILNMIGNEELDNVNKFLEKYEIVLRELYKWIKDYNVAMAVDCDQDPRKIRSILLKIKNLIDDNQSQINSQLKQYDNMDKYKEMDRVERFNKLVSKLGTEIAETKKQQIIAELNSIAKTPEEKEVVLNATKSKTYGNEHFSLLDGEFVNKWVVLFILASLVVFCIYINILHRPFNLRNLYSDVLTTVTLGSL